MSILKVARMGHPVLREKATPLSAAEIRSPAFQQFIDDLIETMHEYQGIGLAAPQVHVRRRVFVAGIEGEGEGEKLRVLPFINPVLSLAEQVRAEDWEGCLSIPDIRGRVPRATEIVVKALDRRGETFEMALRDFPARVVQHEADHLDGILFVDRMTSFESLTFLDEYSRHWAETHER